MANILVIEDEQLIRENILDLLEAENFKVIGAENGQIGLKIAKEQIPDLIICDVMMPELDGYGVLKELRQTPDTATIPFIFLTAKSENLDNRQGMELGADDYISKPCTPDELKRAIAARLTKQAAIDKQQAKKLDDLRNSITFSLPHELRTPLNGILGFSEILMADLDSLKPAQIREIAALIKDSGQHLYRLIFNFLLYAELEIIASDSEQLDQLKNSRPNSTKTVIINEAIQQAKEAKREADLQLDIQDASIQIATSNLQKLVEEIVNNAFKFSSPGTPVSITSRIENNRFILSVQDRGRGMTAEQISLLGAYMQFDRKLYEQQGSGLGLTIAKRLAELHGGKLLIDSQPGQQTTIQVIFLTALDV